MAVCGRKPYSLKLPGGGRIELGGRTVIMGILNVTPDSFSDGGRFAQYDKAVARAFELISDGADILDIGGESTRPGSAPVSLEAEIERVIPVIRAVRAKSAVPISIDTNKAEVAIRAIECGADIINDVSSLRFDPQMAATAARAGVPLVLMHMLGTPRTMQKSPVYSDLISEIADFLGERVRFAVEHGVERDQIVIDPGIGFGKTVEHNLAIIGQLEAFCRLDRPTLLGASRKRFIGSVLDRSEDERELGTAVANAFGIAAGAHIIRVHDVAFHRDAVKMADAIRAAAFTAGGEFTAEDAENAKKEKS